RDRLHRHRWFRRDKEVTMHTTPRASRRRRVLLAAGAALALASFGLLTVGPARPVQAAPAPPAGFSTVWSDDFTGAAGTLPSSANWLFDTGTSYPGGADHWGAGEVETMTNNTDNV